MVRPPFGFANIVVLVVAVILKGIDVVVACPAPGSVGPSALRRFVELVACQQVVGIRIQFVFVVASPAGFGAPIQSVAVPFAALSFAAAPFATLPFAAAPTPTSPPSTRPSIVSFVAVHFAGVDVARVDILLFQAASVEIERIHLSRVEIAGIDVARIDIPRIDLTQPRVVGIAAVPLASRRLLGSRTAPATRSAPPALTACLTACFAAGITACFAAGITVPAASRTGIRTARAFPLGVQAIEVVFAKRFVE